MEPSKKLPRKFKSDADRIVHRHLENKDDKITEEDLKSVRVGISPDEAVETGTEAKARFDSKSYGAKEGNDIESETDSKITPSSGKPLTSWDIIE